MISTEPTDPTKPSLRILVTGSRLWEDRDLVRAELDKLLAHYGPLLVVHGACPTGADAFASEWVIDNWHRGVREERHPADWNTYRHLATGGRGNPAGPIRNKEMVALGARHCLAFILDESPGATGCAEEADGAGIPVTPYAASSRTPA